MTGSGNAGTFGVIVLVLFTAVRSAAGAGRGAGPRQLDGQDRPAAGPGGDTGLRRKVGRTLRAAEGQHVPRTGIGGNELDGPQRRARAGAGTSIGERRDPNRLAGRQRGQGQQQPRVDLALGELRPRRR